MLGQEWSGNGKVQIKVFIILNNRVKCVELRGGFPADTRISWTEGKLMTRAGDEFYTTVILPINSEYEYKLWVTPENGDPDWRLDDKVPNNGQNSLIDTRLESNTVPIFG